MAKGKGNHRRKTWLVVPALVFSSWMGVPLSTDVHAAGISSQVKVTADRLNVRSGPGTNYTIIGGLQQGTIVPVLGASGSWYNVKLSTGATGYIASWYTEPVELESSASIPTVTSFAANASEAKPGEGIRLNITARDDAGIFKVVLYREDYDTNGNLKQSFRSVQSKYMEIGKSISETFLDVPEEPGVYKYGVHVVNVNYGWNDERNSQSGFSPGKYGPVEVKVRATTPAVTSFAANASEAKPGEGIRLNITARDDAGIFKVVLYREDYDTNGNLKQSFRSVQSKYVEIGKSISETFLDVPEEPGVYKYGVHVVNVDYGWNDERNSQSGFSPGKYGPVEVKVRATTPAVTSFAVNASEARLGGGVQLRVSARDDVEIFKAVLYREDYDTNGNLKQSFRSVQSKYVTPGKEISETFVDVPLEPGVYKYGVHVVIVNYGWNDDRN